MKKTKFRIEKSVYDSLLNNTPFAPPETGGVLGGNDGIINCVVEDEGVVSTSVNRYQPNVNKLNCIISKWIKNGIDFMGIFHTHPSGDEKLSSVDVLYIESIMKCVNEYTDRLYFPLIIPKEKIIVFCAINVAGKIDIFQTAIYIL